MKKTALQITGIGEEFLAAALRKYGELGKQIAECDDFTEAEAEVDFRDGNGNTFDGKTRIDVLLFSKKADIPAIPIELKLGKTRMEPTKDGFGRFLGGYEKNKKYENKFKGCMISILSHIKKAGINVGVKAEEIKYPLKAVGDDGSINGTEISEKWILITLTDCIACKLCKNKNVLWPRGTIPPYKIFSLETLFRGKEKQFNEQVKDLVKCDNDDYYSEWIK